jgi:hypothetical protein
MCTPTPTGYALRMTKITVEMEKSEFDLTEEKITLFS